MSTLSKEYITETKKEIQRLEVFVRNYQARIETLKDLLRDNTTQEAAPKATSRKKVSKSKDSDMNESDHGTVANA